MSYVYGQYIFGTIITARNEKPNINITSGNHPYNTREINAFFQKHRLKFFEKNQHIGLLEIFVKTYSKKYKGGKRFEV
jgi:hypothetical protein